mgnify:CR=1 FL=1
MIFWEVLIYLKPKNRHAPHPSMPTQTAHPWSKFTEISPPQPRVVKSFKTRVSLVPANFART